MKKVCFLIAFSAMSIGLHAQNKTSFFVEAQPVFAVQSGTDVGIHLNFGVTFPLSNTASLGVGSGAQSTFKFDNLRIPIFARFVLDNKEYDNSPFFMLDIGCNQDIDGEFLKGGAFGVNVNPTFGFRIGKAYIGVGYLGSFVETIGSGDWHSAINIKLGVSL